MRISKLGLKFLAFAAVPAILFLMLVGFFHSVKNQRGCEWANIDNIEIHAHVNVPAVDSSDCLFDENENMKMAFFQLDTSHLDPDDYVRKNLLKKVESPTPFSPLPFLNITERELQTGRRYVRTDSVNGLPSSHVFFHADEARLWVTIAYPKR